MIQKHLSGFLFFLISFTITVMAHTDGVITIQSGHKIEISREKLEHFVAGIQLIRTDDRDEVSGITSYGFYNPKDKRSDYSKFIKQFPEGSLSFFTSHNKGKIYPFNSGLLVILSKDAEVGSLDVLSIWNIQSERLIFETFLDHVLRDVQKIEEIIPLNNGARIIIGRSGAGDQGDFWGNLWVCLWKNKSNLVELKQFPYSISSKSGNPETIEQRYELNRETFMFKLIESRKIFDSDGVIVKEVKTKNEIVDLMKFINGL